MSLRACVFTQQQPGVVASYRYRLLARLLESSRVHLIGNLRVHLSCKMAIAFHAGGYLVNCAFGNEYTFLSHVSLLISGRLVKWWELKRNQLERRFSVQRNCFQILIRKLLCSLKSSSHYILVLASMTKKNRQGTNDEEIV